MDAFLFLVLLIIAVYICWNCEINRSSVILIVLLGISAYVMANPGTEQFLDWLTIGNVNAAGFKRSSIINMTPEMGITSEISPLFATKNDM